MRTLKNIGMNLLAILCLLGAAAAAETASAPVPAKTAAMAAATAAGSDERGPITVIYRLDDYSARSGTAFELGLIEAFRKRRASLAIGVIPLVGAKSFNDEPQEQLPLPDDKADILKAASAEGVVEVMMHGCRHQANAMKGRVSEFSGLTLAEQTEILKRGKRLLEEKLGFPVDHFCPPWNNYDSNTVAALEATGFKSLSARIRGTEGRASGLKFLPTTCGITGVRAAVELARGIPAGERLVVATFHEFDFKKSKDKRAVTDFAAFEKDLDWIAAQQDVRIGTFASTIAAYRDLGPERLRASRSHFNSPLYYLAPSPFPSPSFPGFYPAAEWMRKRTEGMRFFILGVYGGLVVAGTGAAWFLAGLPWKKAPAGAFGASGAVWAARILLPLVIAVSLYWQIHIEGVFYATKTAITALLLGASLGLWAPRRRWAAWNEIKRKDDQQ